MQQAASANRISSSYIGEARRGGRRWPVPSPRWCAVADTEMLSVRLWLHVAAPAAAAAAATSSHRIPTASHRAAQIRFAVVVRHGIALCSVAEFIRFISSTLVRPAENWRQFAEVNNLLGRLDASLCVVINCSTPAGSRQNFSAF